MLVFTSLPHSISRRHTRTVVDIPSPGRVQALKASTCFSLLEGGSYGLLLPAFSHLFLLWKTCRRRRRPSALHVLHLIVFLQLSQRRVHQDASACLKFVSPPPRCGSGQICISVTLCVGGKWSNEIRWQGVVRALWYGLPLYSVPLSTRHVSAHITDDLVSWCFQRCFCKCQACQELTVLCLCLLMLFEKRLISRDKASEVYLGYLEILQCYLHFFPLFLYLSTADWCVLILNPIYNLHFVFTLLYLYLMIYNPALHQTNRMDLIFCLVSLMVYSLDYLREIFSLYYCHTFIAAQFFTYFIFGGWRQSAMPPACLLGT